MIERHRNGDVNTWDNSQATEDFHTTTDFWECECDNIREAIHPATEEKCTKCGYHMNDSPDARVEDIIRLIRGNR